MHGHLPRSATKIEHSHLSTGQSTQIYKLSSTIFMGVCQMGIHSRGIGLISLKIQGLFERSKFGCKPISNNFTPCCVHFVSVCLKVQKWIQFDTKVTFHPHTVALKKFKRKNSYQKSVNGFEAILTY